MFLNSIFLFGIFAFVHATPIEDIMETEIVFATPSTFTTYRFNTLSVRQLGYSQIFYNNSGRITGKDTDSFQLIQSYAYETRDKNRLCPTEPSGIAAYCDWALTIPCLYAADPTQPPKTIFVHTLMLPHFVQHTLKAIDPTFRFILVTGGVDMTIPRSFFCPYPPWKLPGFSESMDSSWGKLLNDRRIVHWFAENHDMNHPKLSTLPTGLEFKNITNYRVDADAVDFPNRSEIIPILQRPLKFIVSDKVRDGTGFMADRFTVSRLCDELNSTLCFKPGNFDTRAGLPHKDFLKMVASYPFIACIHGGGIESSPKAWEALLVGTIPIIQHSTLDDAYERFPVMFVKDWSDVFAPDFHETMRKWVQKLAPFYEEGSRLRNRVLERLRAPYWQSLFHQKLQSYEDKEMRSHFHNTSHHEAERY